MVTPPQPNVNFCTHVRNARDLYKNISNCISEDVCLDFQSVSIIKSIPHHFQSETQTQLVLSDSSHFTSLTGYSLEGKKINLL